MLRNALKECHAPNCKIMTHMNHESVSGERGRERKKERKRERKKERKKERKRERETDWQKAEEERREKDIGITV